MSPISVSQFQCIRFFVQRMQRKVLNGSLYETKIDDGDHDDEKYDLSIKLGLIVGGKYLDCDREMLDTSREYVDSFRPTRPDFAKGPDGSITEENRLARKARVAMQDAQDRVLYAVHFFPSFC